MATIRSFKAIRPTRDKAHLVASRSYLSYSDETLKENLVAIPNALTKVGLMTGYTYDWKAAKYNDTDHLTVVGESDTGVIAQQVAALGLPGITTTREDGTMAVRYERLVPLLIEAIKELEARVKTLEG